MTREVLKEHKPRVHSLPEDWRIRPILGLGPTAVALGSSQSTVLRLGREGKIRLLKIATRTMVDVQSVIAYLEHRKEVGFFSTMRGNILKRAREKAVAVQTANKPDVR